MDDKETEQAEILSVQTEAHRIAPLLPEERALAAAEDARTRKRFFAKMSAAPPSPALLREALFHYAKGEPPELAAKKAGLKDPAAFKLYLKSENDLRAMMRGVLETDYAPKAFAFLNTTVHDPASPARIRVDAAKILVDRAGFVAAPPDAARDPKDITAMSREELHRFIIAAEAKLASQAEDVTPAGEAPGENESDDAPLPAEAAPQPR